MWFELDGATTHTILVNRALLQEKFPGHANSRLSDINLAARSCDSTSLEFFLWGYIEDRVYASNPQTLNQLKANFRYLIVDILAEMSKLSQNWGM